MKPWSCGNSHAKGFKMLYFYSYRRNTKATTDDAQGATQVTSKGRDII